MLTVRGILHPTDFSALSNNAFRLACGLAQDYHAPLHILHVATAFEAYQGEEIFAKHSAQYLAKDWEKLGAYQWPGVDIHRLLEEGEAAEQIIRTSHAIPCDFIVMGSHGRSGLAAALLLGSVAELVPCATRDLSGDHCEGARAGSGQRTGRLGGEHSDHGIETGLTGPGPGIAVVAFQIRYCLDIAWHAASQSRKWRTAASWQTGPPPHLPAL